MAQLGLLSHHSFLLSPARISGLHQDRSFAEEGMVPGLVTMRPQVSQSSLVSPGRATGS